MSRQIFQPTVNLFKNGIVINYKKVGSRFMQSIASGQDAYDNGISSENNQQIDFQIHDTFFENIFKTNELEYKFFKRFIFSDWHWEIIAELPAKKPHRWNSDSEFLNDAGVSSYTDFFFNNKKNIYFLIRDPVKRFFSGVAQDIISYLPALENSKSEFLFFKNKTDFSDERILELSNLFKNTHSFDDIKDYMSNEDLLQIFNFFLAYKWDLIRQDIHTEPYLLHFREMIYNMSDLSKIKILDLKQMSTKKSHEFLSELRGDDFPMKVYESTKDLKGSNKNMYSFLLDAYYRQELVQVSFDREFSIIDDYLKYETIIYDDLINSPYFLNLED